MKDLKEEMEKWFKEYVIPDIDGRIYNVTGYGQLRPVGRKWEDGKEPFAEVVEKPSLHKNR
jgi:hypothetical protein